MNYVKKGMLLLTLLVALSYSGYSQDTSSTRIPNVNLRAAVKIIEGLRIDSLIMARDNQILRERITARDNTVAQMSQRIKDYKVLSANYDKQILNLNKQVELSTGLNKTLDKKLKWSSTKTIIVAIAGVILGTLYIAK